MKTKKMIALLMLASIGFVSCKKETAAEPKQEEVQVETVETTETPAAKEVVANQTIDFKVDGMTCAMGCAAKIEKELNAMPGVAHAKVDFDAKKAVVSFDNQQLSQDQIVAKVESIADGTYKVSDVQQSSEELAVANQTKKACCSPDKKEECGKDKKGEVKACCKEKDGKEKQCCKDKDKK